MVRGRGGLGFGGVGWGLVGFGGVGCQEVWRDVAGAAEKLEARRIREAPQQITLQHTASRLDGYGVRRTLMITQS